MFITKGNIAGYTTFLALLPEYETSLFVAVNSIGLADPAGWVTQLVIETIIESPVHMISLLLPGKQQTDMRIRDVLIGALLMLCRSTGQIPDVWKQKHMQAAM